MFQVWGGDTPSPHCRQRLVWAHRGNPAIARRAGLRKEPARRVHFSSTRRVNLDGCAGMRNVFRSSISVDSIYRSSLNRDVAPASPGEFKPLRLGPIQVWPPVVLAPMAGVTNYPFRSLCSEFGAGLCVSEMITARPLVDGNEKTLKLAGFGADEGIKSLQLYGVDPFYVGEAVKRLVGEGAVHHIDMNFGCPVRKVTRRGGGAAIPLKPRLLQNIVHAAVSNAGSIPVTIKFRMGVDDDHLTFLESGRIGQEEGCALIAMHARTAAQLYDGMAKWAAIGELKERVTRIPVLGNGDIWEAEDGLRMMRETGCDGVVVGRGCLGRPWIFRDLAAVFDGKSPENPPNLNQVTEAMADHAARLSAWTGEEAAMRAFRRHATWYIKGFRGSARMRAALMQITNLSQLQNVLAEIASDEPYPVSAMRVKRGKTAGTQKVALPPGYLDELEDSTPPGPEAEAGDGG